MTATEKIPIAPHRAHLVHGYRLRASGNTPALTKSRMVKYKRTWSKRSLDTTPFPPQPVRTSRLLCYSNVQE